MIRVLQIIDTLRVGGAERMAVNLANSLHKYSVDSHFCATRSGGPLLNAIDEKVPLITLNKKSIFDVKAVRKLNKYIKENKINVVHAHGTSFLQAVVAKFFNQNIKIVWHDHFGNRLHQTNLIKFILLKLCSFKFGMIYCVNTELEEWSKKKLNSPKVKFLSNYPSESRYIETELFGLNGSRILCSANLRDPKNHIELFAAFKEISNKYHNWTLHCIGNDYGDEYSQQLKKFIKDNNLENQIFIYGAKNDVSNIISQCEIGVLVSKYEGLPMSVLEYGLGKLAVLCTNVGHCKTLIVNTNYGVLVEVNEREALIDGLDKLISNQDYRKSCASNFHNSIMNKHSEIAIIDTVIVDYKSLV